MIIWVWAFSCSHSLQWSKCVLLPWTPRWIVLCLFERWQMLMVSQGKTLYKVPLLFWESPVWPAQHGSVLHLIIFLKGSFGLPLAHFSVISLVHWYSVITVVLCLCWSVNALFARHSQSLTSDRQSAVPLAWCHSADVFINTALFQIKCHLMNPKPSSQ